MVKKRVYRRKKPAKRRARRKSRQRRSPYMRYVADAGVFCFTLMIGFAALFAYIVRDMPDTSAMWRDGGAPKITLLAADGSPLTVNGASAGAPVRLADLPDHVPNAILAVEDRNFYHHFGVNPVSVLRALIVNARTGEVVQGGSTITQQLAKNVFLSSDRTIKRKAQEFVLALWLEQKFTKDEILTLYLNRVYFGAGAYGIDAASYRYFGKSASRLSLGEAAVLAGLLKAPSRLAPTSNPEDAGRRGRLVIDQMVTAGFLSAAQAAETVSRPILLSSKQNAATPYFIDYALARVRALSGDIDADLVVRTTFSPETQAAAELGLIAGFANASGELDAAQGAVVIMDAEGGVKAMIGGRDYHVSQFNRATQAKRQPGSAFKPFVFLTALEQGYTADAIVLDAPYSVGKWSPDNYKSKYYGDVTLREALARSLNGATVRVQETVGRNEVRRTARAMGWGGALTAGPALALGVDALSPLELAAVYAPFANGGFRVEPHVIESIKTADGDPVYSRQSVYIDQAASRASIEQMNAMLESVVAWGSGRAAAVPGYAAAGKTGTSQDSRDAWFAGHAGGMVGVVWVGRDDYAPVDGLSGGRAPAVIWREVMSRVLPPRYVEPAYIAPLQPEPSAPKDETLDDPIAAVISANG